MPTPTTWLAKFTANLLTPDVQENPQIVGLSNGNFLVVWEDSNNSAANGVGKDIVGVIYDPLGNAISGSIFLNSVSGSARQETNPMIAARPDGGFVVVYEFASASDNDIIYGIYNSTGQAISHNFIENDPTSPSLVYNKPSVAVASDGSFFVSYQRDDGTNQEIVGRKVASDGTVGALVVVRQDGPSNGADLENARDPDTAALANGGFVTTYLVNDDFAGDNEALVEVRITNADGTNSTLISTVAQTDGQSDSNPQVAVLSDSRFVVAWNENGVIRARIYNQNGTSSLEEFNITNNASLTFLLLDIVALDDGGYVTLFQDTTEGRMLVNRGKNGVPDGNILILDSGAGIASNGSLGLTSDGRIVATWSNGEVQSIILDPRGSVINAKTGGGVTTGRQNGSTINGSSSDDVIHGVGGNDVIVGNGGNDTMFGGLGDDTYFVQQAGDIVTELAGQGNDLVYVTDVGTFTLSDHVEVGAAFGSTLNIIGNSGANTLIGNAMNNVLNGGGGDDIIFGVAGGNSLIGGAGNDALVSGTGAEGMSGGANDDTYIIGAGDIVTENPGEGTDTVYSPLATYFMTDNVEIGVVNGGTTLIGNSGANTLIGDGNFNVLSGLDGSDFLVGGAGGDVLIGGGGLDVLQGNGGGDVFWWTAMSELGDIIQDWVNTEDQLQFTAGGFFNFAGAILINGVNFIDSTNPTPTTANATFLWDIDDTNLFFDPDGNGAAGRILVADFQAFTTLDVSDFQFV